MIMKYISILFLSLLLLNCNEKQSKSIDADEIIQKSITVSGVEKLNVSKIAFDFREFHFIAERNQGKFELQRQFKDSIGSIHDYLNNKGFERRINDTLVNLPDSLSTKYAASVNSVHYFAVLPYGLDGNAVNKTLLKDVNIKDKPYHKIKVDFNQDGGGEDFEDEYIYWINTQTSKIDYFAYSYKEIDGMGFRFREAYNERYINGVRFVDYNNFKPKGTKVSLENLDTLFNENNLELLSKIELKNITVD